MWSVFITGNVTTGPGRNLRGDATFRDYLEPWCYKRLLGASLWISKQVRNNNIGNIVLGWWVQKKLPLNWTWTVAHLGCIFSVGIDFDYEEICI